MTIHDHIPLRDRCWFRTGGVAQYYVSCTQLRDVLDAIAYALQHDLRYEVIGTGSGILISDSGIQGLVVQNQTTGLVFVHDRSQVMVESGFLVSQLVNHTLSQGYAGLEFLIGLPGSLGGAVYSNAVVFGRSVGDYVKSATLYFPRKGRTVQESVQRVERDWFRFRPGSSRLKEMRRLGQEIPILLSITLQLAKINPSTCLNKGREYHKQWLDQRIPPAPWLHVFDQLSFQPREGSVRVTSSQSRQWRRGDVQVAPHNPNFLIHHGMGTSTDARNLIEQIQTEVLGAHHEARIEYLGLWSPPEEQDLSVL